MASAMKIDDIAAMVVRLEAKVDVVIQLVSRNGDDRGGVRGADSLLSRLTTKQHACLQMLLVGASNVEIAERFGVTVNTAKVYVRSIASKLGVNTRNQIVVKMYEPYKNADVEEYSLLSGGLPKDWAANYTEPDAYKPLYGMKTR